MVPSVGTEVYLQPQPCIPRSMGVTLFLAHNLTTTEAPGDGATDLQKTRSEAPQPFTSTAFSMTNATGFCSVLTKLRSSRPSRNWAQWGLCNSDDNEIDQRPAFQHNSCLLVQYIKMRGAETPGDRLEPTFFESSRPSRAQSVAQREGV